MVPGTLVMMLRKLQSFVLVGWEGEVASTVEGTMMTRCFGFTAEEGG